MSPSIDLRESREFASEIKFLIAPALAGQIRDWARARMAPDPNASGESADAYKITSLYFDTQQFDVFHRKGSFGRSKYRIRRYGESHVAFLERKLKTRGLVTKRRSIVELNELQRLSNAGAERSWPGHWFRQRLAARRFRLICQISYRRTARVATTDYGPIRLTLDENIRALPAAGLVFDDTTDGTTLAASHVILELKFRFEIPVIFKLLVEEFALNPQPISKYRLAAVALGCVTAPQSIAPVNGHPAPIVCLTS
jgi:VTC domain-containing protein